MPVDPIISKYLWEKFHGKKPEQKPELDGQMAVAGAGDVISSYGKNVMRIAGVGTPESQSSQDAIERQRQLQQQQDDKRDQDKTRAAQALYEMSLRADRDAKEDEWRKDDMAFKQKSLAQQAVLAREKAAAEANKPTVGQDAADREYGKNYNSWTSGGAKAARTEIGKLQSVANNLRDKKVTTGGMTGAFPDRFTSNEVLQARADVQSTIMNSLRAILGAQFTEKEGERILRATWNEADSTENNMARINRLITDLTNKADDNDRKAQFFEQSGTLRGYQSGAGSKPKRVIQNGHEYILNEQTGEYE